MSENFVVTFSARTAQFMRATQSLSDRLTGIGRAAAGIVARGGLLAGGALVGAGFGASATLDKMNTFAQLANRIRVDPKLIQVFDRFAKIKGVDTDQLVEVIEEIQRTAGEGKFDLLEKVGLDERTLKPLLDQPIKLLGTFVDNLRDMGLSEAIAAAGPIVGEDVARQLVGLSRLTDEQRRLVESSSVERDRFSTARQIERIQTQMGSTGQLLDTNTSKVEKLREGWYRLVGIIEAFALRLAEKALPNVTKLAEQVERWLHNQGGLGAIASEVVAFFERAAESARQLLGSVDALLAKIDKLRAIPARIAEEGERVKGFGRALINDPGERQNLLNVAKEVFFDRIKDDAKEAERIANQYIEVAREQLRVEREIARNTAGGAKAG